MAAAAIRELAVDHPRLRLVVMGDGPDRAEVAELLRPIGERVVLTGHRDDVMDVLDASDVLIHPSRVDAFPTALLEAAAASRPVVATNVGGISGDRYRRRDRRADRRPPTAAGLFAWPRCSPRPIAAGRWVRARASDSSGRSELDRGSIA